MGKKLDGCAALIVLPLGGLVVAGPFGLIVGLIAAIGFLVWQK